MKDKCDHQKDKEYLTQVIHLKEILKKKKKERKLINKSQQKHRDEQREVRVHLVPMEKRHLVSRD